MLTALKLFYTLIPKWVFAAAAIALLMLNIGAGLYILGLKTQIEIQKHKILAQENEITELKAAVKKQNDAVQDWKKRYESFKKQTAAAEAKAKAEADELRGEAQTWREKAARRASTPEAECQLMRDDIDEFLKQQRSP